MKALTHLRLSLTLLSLFFAIGLNAAPILELSPTNWETKLKGKTVLVYMSLGCDVGSFSSQMFRESLDDLEGVYVSAFDVNSASKMMQGKPYDLSSIVLIQDGKVLESSEESGAKLGGYNHKRIWVYNTLKKHNIAFRMAIPEQSRLKPLADNGPVDLNKGLNAIYRFDNGLADETGQRKEFRLHGTAKVVDGAFYADGVYDSNRTSGSYQAFDYGEKGFPNGFTVHANVKVSKSEERRKFVLGLGYRKFEFSLFDDELMFNAHLYGKLAPEDYEYSDDNYYLSEVPFEYDQWNSFIISTDFYSKRIYLVINGKRYDDIHLSNRFIEFFKKYGVGTDGVKFYNYGWGAILNGYADDVVVYERKLNISEMMALYNKYTKNPNRPSVVNEVIGNDVVYPVSPESPSSPASVWAGDWQTTWGEDMIFTQIRVDNGKVEGEYNHEGGKMMGKASESGDSYSLTGTWIQKNTRGWFQFEMKKGENKFTGTWGYTGSNKPSGTWNGFHR
ncbi:hypothetical protein R9C00_15135 [Flammeovirgaceae bacterium SG7u.111]|nr:hypothetical protein [Flammeovirgaceae bacterium SG7u.132]WPO33036.1 hypothetical protein R9C00_15135 [Flammeovirgaceae bacterium SG7u.111]